MTTTELKGRVVVAVQGQTAQPAWMQNLLKKALDNGVGADQELRFTCRIAQDAKAAFARITTADGSDWVLNPKAAPQFGRNRHGNAYLTLGLIHEATGGRVRITWEGEGVPPKMKEVAVKHDEGRRVGATRIALNLEDAEVTELLERTEGDRNRARRYEAKSARHVAGTTRRHGRLCATDLA
jgi:hypothetical protein